MGWEANKLSILWFRIILLWISVLNCWNTGYWSSPSDINSYIQLHKTLWCLSFTDFIIGSGGWWFLRKGWSSWLSRILPCIHFLDTMLGSRARGHYGDLIKLRRQQSGFEAAERVWFGVGSLVEVRSAQRKLQKLL